MDSSSSNATKFYTRAEIARHKDAASGYWIIVDGCVYDVTSFLTDHPGGPTLLKRLAGKDASKLFWKYHNKGVVAQYSQKLKVGEVKEESKL